MKKIYFIMMAVMALMFAGCSSDEKFTENANETKLTFDFTVEGTPTLGGETRAVKKAWENGDCVFVALWGDSKLWKAGTYHGKYMKLTYDASTKKWNVSLEGTLTKEELKTFANSENPNISACYIQGVTELQGDKLEWKNKFIKKCEIGSTTYYFMENPTPLFTSTDYDNPPKLSINGAGVVSATIKLSDKKVGQIAVTGLTLDDDWYFISGANVYFDGTYGFTSGSANRFSKGIKSTDATEVEKKQFDFFFRYSFRAGNDVRLVNLSKQILYTKQFSSSIATGKATRTAGPTDLTIKDGNAGNGWTASSITITDK